MANIQGRITLNEILLLEVDGDPSTGGGTAASIGTLAILDDSASTAIQNRPVWRKYGALDTEWCPAVFTFGSPTQSQTPTWNSTLSRWEPKGGLASGGVTPPFVFSKDGNLGVGTYLRTGSVITNSAGQLIKGNSTIIEISVTLAAVVGTTTRIQFQRRTAVSTFTDITNAYVDIPAGQYKAQNTGLAINIGPDYELACYNQSGVTLSNPVLVLYLVPQ